LCQESKPCRDGSSKITQREIREIQYGHFWV
jgi:hypothetical protein